MGQRTRSSGLAGGWRNGRAHARNLLLRVQERLTRDVRVECPCCGWTGLRFRSYDVGDGIVDNEVCSACESHKRQRLLCILLKRRVSFFREMGITLHFAPEQAFGAMLRASPGARVFGCDLERAKLAPWPGEGFRCDIRRMALPDGSVNTIVCSHVLEHVAEESEAVAELYRILKTTGVALILVPAHHELASTIDFPPDRQHPFGHLRDYSVHDMAHRLRPFTVAMARPADFLSPPEIERYGIWEGEVIFVCRKALA